MKAGKKALAALAVVAVLFVSGCGDDDGLSQAEVEEVIQEAVAGIPDSEPGLSSADVEEAVREALASLPEPAEGLSRAEVEEVVREAIDKLQKESPPEEAAPVSAPSKSNPSEYTKHVVNEAVLRYMDEGLDATLAHYNSSDSIDGQWYVFIVDESDEVIGHYDPGRLGLDVKGWVGTDINGYQFGPSLLAADEEGRWVSYVYKNPELDDGEDGSQESYELKIVWAVRHDGLIFGSGWYISTEEFIPPLVIEMSRQYRQSGLEATVAYFADPDSITGGLQEAVKYYNANAVVEGAWLGFIADPDGVILEHNDRSLLGTNIHDLLGSAVDLANEEGLWVTESDNPPQEGPSTMRVFVADYQGTTFGAGWYNPAGGN